MARVAVSIGSNLEREHNVKDALAALGKTFGELLRSPVYESAAYGFDGPPFYNLVVVFETPLDVRAVRAKIQAIENLQGRKIGENRSGSRSLDLDLLLYDDAVFRRACLHPEAARRSAARGAPSGDGRILCRHLATTGFAPGSVVGRGRARSDLIQATIERPPSM